MSYQKIKPLRRQIERHINRAMHHLRADHTAAAYCEFQHAFGILAGLIVDSDKENPL